jgi:hypothetical protein
MRVHVNERLRRLFSLIGAWGVAVLATAVVGCSSSSSVPNATATATADGLPVSSPFSIPGTIAVTGGTVGVTFTGSAYGAQTSLAVATGIVASGLTSFANQSPSGVPAFATATSSTVAVECFDFQQAVVLTAPPAFSFVLPAGLFRTGIAWYLAVFDPTLGAWNGGFGGPGLTIASLDTVVIAGVSAVTFPAGRNVCFALYAQPGSAAAPTPGPASAVVAAPPALSSRT